MDYYLLLLLIIIVVIIPKLCSQKWDSKWRWQSCKRCQMCTEEDKILSCSFLSPCHMCSCSSSTIWKVMLRWNSQ